MFLILSRIFSYASHPITPILFSLLFAVFTKYEKRRKRAVLFGLILLLFFTNPFICNEAFLLWEQPPTPISQLSNYDAAIILNGGVTSSEKSPHDRVYTGKVADRELQPLQLYKKGIIGKIVISGGPSVRAKDYLPESSGIKLILLNACVPASAILIEDSSRNTHENALFFKALQLQHCELKKLLLVTSAYHMKRAVSSFKKEGIRVDGFSTDFYSHDRSFALEDVLAPSGENMVNWQILIHEIIGYSIYRIAGYS
jgi:uncharacterized SAM-binding protein YcdF (DUF218 family)